MTQPPPPPSNQPPPGFGAPQEPPPGFAGGFGAPVPPPHPQPGYGHPQAPGPGYGPGTAPGYGYGYPAQPAPPPPPPPPGRRGLGIRARIVVSAAVAVVLIIGSGVWYASTRDAADPGKDRAGNSAGGSGGEKDRGAAAPDGPGKEKAPADTGSAIAFEKPAPAHDGLLNVEGSWLTEKAYIKPGIRSVTAHDPVRGTPLWTLKLPGQICASSRHVSADNKTAVAFEATARTKSRAVVPCTEVGAVDLNTGKLLWSRSVTGAITGDNKVNFSEVTQSGTTVAAGGLSGGAAFDLNTGTVRWKPTVDADQCFDQGYGGGAALVAVRKCGDYDKPSVTIQRIDPSNGTPLFSYKMPPTVGYASVVSTDPLVVAADVGDTAGVSGFSDLFSLDGKGALLARIPAAADKFSAQCRTTRVESCNKLAVGNGRIYLPTDKHEGKAEFSDTNEVVSYDLTTGKPTSDRADAGDRYTMFPLRMDGGNVIAYKRPPYDKGGQIVSIDGATFKQTVLMENPQDRAVRAKETGFSPDSAEFRYRAGRLYIATPSLSGYRHGKEFLAVAFSTAD
ncbi:PQQ-binding-like beta-propeller repeat protein [Streptomyces sp. CAU 1734]|uniref:outer membrane protein assembly factor BamB family protein n=1 Tax=Streptomyces sp. CAU 1734 TaxID=3140360 RepID=UPI0032607B66